MKIREKLLTVVLGIFIFCILLLSKKFQSSLRSLNNNFNKQQSTSLWNAASQNLKIEVSEEKRTPDIPEADAENFEREQHYGEPKQILVYDRLWSGADYEIGLGMFRNCRVRNCMLTGRPRSDKERQSFDSSAKWMDWDAILWDNVVSRDMHKPPERSSHTRYVLMNREGPARYGGLKDWPVTFNWTMTYRIDSDVPFRYGYVYRFSSPRPLILPKYKPKLAAWMSSDNHSMSGREQLKLELEKNMHIDIYGRQGTLECGIGCRARNGDTCDSDCRDMIGDNYKFYFAFEPTLCKDWTTEKLYTMLQRPIVPVIWSGADLSLLAPPHSAINALDFETAKDLVDYLNYLDGNDTAYFEYFNWKKYYGIIAGTDSLTLSFCHLCARLHEDNGIHWYEHLHDWWTKDQCINPNSARIRQFLNINDDSLIIRYPHIGEHFNREYKPNRTTY